MVENAATQRFGGGDEAARGAKIGIARTRVPARMVVREQDTGARMVSGIGNDRPQRKVDAACVAIVAGKVKATRLVVEMRDPKALAAVAFFDKAAGEERARRSQAF